VTNVSAKTDFCHDPRGAQPVPCLEINTTSMTTGKALLGILAGIAAGAVIGVLLSPEKGDQSRKSLRKKSEDLADAINDKIDEKFEDLLKSISGKVKQSEQSEKGEA
jgi:gas vesicle protein